MIKSKFFKALILGACLVALSSTAAFAEEGGRTVGAVRGEVEMRLPAPGVDTGNADSPSMKKQREIDMYVFKEHIKDIEAKGFKVTHTAPMDGYVEVGILPYSEDNAAYLYEIFGKDMLKVVEGVQAVLVTAPDIGFDGSASGREPAGAYDGGKVVSGNATSSNVTDGDIATSNEVTRDEARISNTADDLVLYTAMGTGAESADASGLGTLEILLMAGGAVILLGSIVLVTRRLKTANR